MTAQLLSLRQLRAVRRLLPAGRPADLRFILTSTTNRSGSCADFRVGGLRLPDAELPSDLEQATDSEFPAKKSRNQKKREARRAVQWGVDLASFSTPRIKRILRVASVEREVFDALMLVKKLGPDVREGKRRQFNYIGRLLRNAQPELMDALIQASKDGDNSKLQTLTGESLDEDDEEEEEEFEDEKDDEDTCDFIEVAMQWYDGLVDQDSSITSEVYSIHNVDFDRQELRKLVRRVRMMQDNKPAEENGEDGDSVILGGPKKSLMRFLRRLARQTLITREI